MEEAEFASHREALVKAKTEAPKTLRHESQVYWAAISSGTCDYHKQLKDVMALKTLTKADVLQYWHDVFDASAPNRRKLASHTYAPHVALPARSPISAHGREIHYIDGLQAVYDYKRTLPAYPAPSRIDKKMWS